MPKLPLIKNITGLNTVTNPYDIEYNPEALSSDLGAAINVQVTRAGNLETSTGYVKRIDVADAGLNAGSFHSLYSNRTDAYVGKGKSLYRFVADNQLVGVRSGLSGNRISYLQYGEKIFYVNGVENGFLIGGYSYPWPVDTYLGPDTTEPYEQLPIGNKLEVLSGRIYAPVDNTLWWSEPYQPGLCNVARNFRKFNSRIIMVAAVATGLYISTEDAHYFLRGTNPHEFQLERVLGYPAIEWALLRDRVSALKLGIEEYGLLRIWGSVRGLVLGLPSGNVVNATENKVFIPDCSGGIGAITLFGDQVIYSTGD